jgi:hypothetical protein
MKPLLLASSLLTVLALLPHSFAADRTADIVPVTPEALLGALPGNTDAWTLVRSDASTTLQEHLQTRAVRIYRAKAPATAESTAAAAPVIGEVKVRLVDHAGRTPSDFVDFKPGKSATSENLLIGSYPTISSTRNNTRQFKVWLANRYVTEITFVDLPREKPEAWLQALNFEGLRHAKAVPIPVEQREFTLRFVDELHPKNNRQQRITTSAAHAAPPVDDEKK